MLRVNTALYFPATAPYAGRGHPRLYGQRFNPQQIDPKYRVSTQTHENITTQVYQAELRHKKFPEPLNVVCILKTQLLTEKKSHVLLLSSDLALDAEKIIDYYAIPSPKMDRFLFSLRSNSTPLECGNLFVIKTRVAKTLHTRLKYLHDLKYFRKNQYLRQKWAILHKSTKPL